jgi:hypothetical protein
MGSRILTFIRNRWIMLAISSYWTLIVVIIVAVIGVVAYKKLE